MAIPWPSTRRCAPASRSPTAGSWPSDLKALIAAGDAYQVNLTFPIRFRHDGDPLALYAALRTRQPVAHGGVVAFRSEGADRGGGRLPGQPDLPDPIPSRWRSPGPLRGAAHPPAGRPRRGRGLPI